MTYVEHIYPRFQWAEPLPGNKTLEVTVSGDDLQVVGLFPSYTTEGPPSDLMRQYQFARKDRSVGKQTTGKDSPHITFANADTDEKLIAFVRTFGPVVAKSVRLTGGPPPILTAAQSMKELRRERVIYHAALSLLNELSASNFERPRAQEWIKKIAANIRAWPRQWNRERKAGEKEPLWRLSTTALKRITQLGTAHHDLLLPPEIDARIVVCELINSFRSLAFPNPLEAHSSIRLGIRPLLYSIIRREFIYPHDTAVCANTRCRDFYEIEREGQQFCSADCSRRQRQRDYWQKRGKTLRAKRKRIR